VPFVAFKVDELSVQVSVFEFLVAEHLLDVFYVFGLVTWSLFNGIKCAQDSTFSVWNITILLGLNVRIHTCANRRLWRCFVKYEVAAAKGNCDLNCYDRELDRVCLHSKIVKKHLGQLRKRSFYLVRKRSH